MQIKGSFIGLLCSDNGAWSPPGQRDRGWRALKVSDVQQDPQLSTRHHSSLHRDRRVSTGVCESHVVVVMVVVVV